MTRLAVGTEKGAYLVDDDKGDWRVNGPLFPGWKVTTFGRAGERHLAAVASNWFGVGIHQSTDLENWDPIDDPPAWEDDTERKMEQIWRIHADGETLFAGVAEAGLFTSTDGGTSWIPVDGLNEHRTRDNWQPGFGGLAAHKILTGGGRTWVGISAVGVFRSDDDGQTWELKNDGVPPAGDASDERPEVGYCVHALAQDPESPDRIWRQDHRGMYRTTDGGDHWEHIDNGLPADFGFVIWRDASSGRLFTVPLESDMNRLPVNGELRVYASDDDGESWAVSGAGWPGDPQFTGVLRAAFDGDGQGTFAFGTTGGRVTVTRDNGETWSTLGSSFPRIGAVSII